MAFCFMAVVAAQKLTTAFLIQARWNMIILMKKNATEEEISHVTEWITSVGYQSHLSRGVERTIIGAIGDDRGKERLRVLEALECVETVMPILQPFKLASREVRPTSTQVQVDGVAIGGERLVVMAGPCAVESREQLMEIALEVKGA
ncbi:MAG: hypothetical protein Q8O11_03640, partial [Syntrophales bacterium]|nr:hypothetical protein [Syntrophales bacterium]